MEVVDLTGLLLAFRFENRVIFEVIVPRNAALEALVELRGHVLAIQLQVTADHGEPSSLEDFLITPRAATAV